MARDIKKRLEEIKNDINLTRRKIDGANNNAIYSFGAAFCGTCLAIILICLAKNKNISILPELLWGSTVAVILFDLTIITRGLKYREEKKYFEYVLNILIDSLIELKDNIGCEVLCTFLVLWDKEKTFSKQKLNNALIKKELGSDAARIIDCPDKFIKFLDRYKTSLNPSPDKSQNINLQVYQFKDSFRNKHFSDTKKGDPAFLHEMCVIGAKLGFRTKLN